MSETGPDGRRGRGGMRVERHVAEMDLGALDWLRARMSVLPRGERPAGVLKAIDAARASCRAACTGDLPRSKHDPLVRNAVRLARASPSDWLIAQIYGALASLHAAKHNAERGVYDEALRDQATRDRIFAKLTQLEREAGFARRVLASDRTRAKGRANTKRGKGRDS